MGSQELISSSPCPGLNLAPKSHTDSLASSSKCMNMNIVEAVRSQTVPP
jgi:hypothetical protein